MPLRSLTVVLTGRCNLRCRYCYASGRPAAARWPVVRRSLDALLAGVEGCVEIGFTGGEPLLALPMLKQVVEHVERRRAPGRDVQWTLLTNGLLMDDATMRYLDAHLFGVDLSFDGVEPAQSFRAPGSFPVLDRLLDRFRDLAPGLWAHRLKIMCTVSPESVPFLADSVDYFIGKRAPLVAIGPAMGPSEWPVERIADLEHQFRKVVASALALYDRSRAVPLAFLRKTKPDGASEPAEWLCGAARGENLAIDVNGRVYGCLLASATYQSDTPDAMRPAVAALDAGSTSDAGFATATAALPAAAEATGVFQHTARRYSSYGRCEDCRYVGRCVACPLAPAHDPGCADPHRVSDFICAWNQTALAARDAFPSQPGIQELLARIRGS